MAQTGLLGKKIGSGTRADVYRHGGYAYKVFHKGAKASAVFREAYIGALAAEAGLPSPGVYGVVEKGGCLSIKMEEVPGGTLHEAAARHPERCGALIGELARLHAGVHQSTVALPFSFVEWLRQRLGAGQMEEALRARLLGLLARLPQGAALCHGDFHGGNVLVDGARLTIIDWANACAGHPDADACRTYLIYALHMPQLAEAYLEAYCSHAQCLRADILHWLPVLAGARLGEGFPEERPALLAWASSCPA